MMDRIYKTPQRRWKCPHCCTEGWETPGSVIAPQHSHDRPDGRRCRKAWESYQRGKLEAWAQEGTPADK